MATARIGKKYRVPVELAAWFADQAVTRGVSENLLVTRALEHYREVLTPIGSAAPTSVEILDQATAALDATR